ncbi:MAG: DUF2933 domain-containing protein [Rhizobiales bacterium]|nr:DUF2933 domain-containing protein [Hyphomicrobiales bacterium]
MQHSGHGDDASPSPRRWSRANIALVAFLAIAGFYLITEHRAHAFGILPFLLLAACPLLHLFMHGGRGHGGHGDAETGSPRDKQAGDSQPPAPPAAGRHSH